MKRALFIVLMVALAAGLASPPRLASANPPDFTGNGSVRANRLPWLAGDVKNLNQGWFGSFSHSGQFATDWDGEFFVLTASEGSAICKQLDGGAGNHIELTRNDGLVEHYMHLKFCPIPETPATHYEQGDVLAISWETGCVRPCIHLHYEVTTTGGTSVTHSLSQFDDFTHSEFAGKDLCCR